MRISVCAVVLAGLLLAASALPAQQVQILMTGQFHGNEITASSGETWFGLFAEGKKYRLVRTTINVTPIRDDIVGDEEDEKTGKLVSCNKSGKPLFLVRGIRGLSEIMVDTAWQGEKFFYPGESGSYYFDGTHTGIMAFGEAVKTENYGGFFYRNYSLFLIKGREERSFIHFERLSPDARPHLIWVGDLDNDKKMDMFWDLTDHYNKRQFTLFLSSLAGEGEWLKKAAELITLGC